MATTYTGPGGTSFTVEPGGGYVKIEGDDGSEYHVPLADVLAFARDIERGPFAPDEELVTGKLAAAKSHEPRDPAGPCPDCGRAWNANGARHCQRAIAGTVCGVDGCKKRPLTQCFVGAELVGSWCPVGNHRWRKPEG